MAVSVPQSGSPLSPSGSSSSGGSSSGGSSSGGSPPGPAPGAQPPRSAAPARARKELRLRLWSWEAKVAPYAYVTPFFALFLGFGLFPLVYTAWISLHRYKLGGAPMQWLGFENYTWLFTNGDFYNSLWKTFTIGVISTVPQLVLALGLAHLLNYRMRVRNFFRVSMIMPYATSVAASTLVFVQIFSRNPDSLANAVVGIFGFGPYDWQNGDWTAQIAIATIVTWQWAGYNALIYLAGMQSISTDLYEAAAIDGASRWRQFLNVTLPGLRPTILFTVVVSTIGATQLFAQPLLFAPNANASGGNLHQYQTLGLLMYQQGWVYGQLGRAATVAWVTFLLIIILVVLNTTLARLRTRDRPVRPRGATAQRGSTGR